MRMVATAAPPPSNAEPSANNWEMLVKEPTISSGEGIAKADPVPIRHTARPMTRQADADRSLRRPALDATHTPGINPLPTPTQASPPHREGYGSAFASC